MKVQDIMTRTVISIAPGETAEAAARTLSRYNVGVLPVCSNDGKLCGMITDRDVVIRCIAAGRIPGDTAVREVMTSRVISVQPDVDVGVAAHLMGRQQVRRLPVVREGKLCGMVSLGDMAKREESVMDAADALNDISSNLTKENAW